MRGRGERVTAPHHLTPRNCGKSGVNRSKSDRRRRNNFVFEVKIDLYRWIIGIKFSNWFFIFRFKGGLRKLGIDRDL